MSTPRLPWLLLILAAPGEACSASSNHPHYLRRAPPLFNYNSNLTRTEELCRRQLKGRDSLACEAVDVNLQAFLAKSLTVRIVPDAVVTNSVNEEEQGRDVQLIKRMQLGLELALKEPSAPVTAQVQYTGKSGNVIFVIKTGQVYGSIGEGGLTYSLEPCLAADPPCHLWIKAAKKKQLV